jgi:hypothetical protein
LITEFGWKEDDKNTFAEKKHSSIKNDTLPYRCRPQKWLMLRRRERTHLQNNIKAKPEQLKLSKIDPSMWP